MIPLDTDKSHFRTHFTRCTARSRNAALLKMKATSFSIKIKMEWRRGFSRILARNDLFQYFRCCNMFLFSLAKGELAFLGAA